MKKQEKKDPRNNWHQLIRRRSEGRNRRSPSSLRASEHSSLFLFFLQTSLPAPQVSARACECLCVCLLKQAKLSTRIDRQRVSEGKKISRSPVMTKDRILLSRMVSLLIFLSVCVTPAKAKADCLPAPAILFTLFPRQLLLRVPEPLSFLPSPSSS